jgi:hypothetical protein
MSTLDPVVATGLERAPQAGWKKIVAHEEKADIRVNGSNYLVGTGLDGTDYLQRAFVTAIGLGANRPQDALYLYTSVDGNGKQLSDANKYVIRFPKGQNPAGKRLLVTDVEVPRRTTGARPAPA